MKEFDINKIEKKYYKDIELIKQSLLENENLCFLQNQGNQLFIYNNE